MNGEPDYASLAHFRFLLRRFLAFSAGKARSAGIEPRQHQLLLSLKGLPPDQPPTIKALANHLLLKHHSAVELIDRMERNGLVTRRRDPGDGRVVLVDITAHGEGLLRELALDHQAELRTTGPALVAALDQALAGAPAPASAFQPIDAAPSAAGPRHHQPRRPR